MSAHGEWKEVRNPGPFQFPGTVKTVFLIFLVVGIASFGGGLALERKRAWFSFLQGHFYFLSLALGGLFFAAVQWLTSAMWSAPVRRISESFTAYLPIVFITTIALYFGLHDLYIWTDPAHVRGDAILEHKAGYLNATFFLVRNLVAVAIWVFFARKFVGNSLRQDLTKDARLTLSNRSWSPAFLILFGITYTMAAFDQLMSLDPHWFSTMFGVYCFAGMFYITLAAIAIVTIYLRRQGALQGIVNENHLHDLGKFMFAFSVFYAYIAFSQFMLIWYANLPEETGYFLRRMNGSWMWITVFLLIGKFLVPFIWLLPREAKRDEKTLVRVGIWMLIAHWVDIFWLVGPEFSAQAPQLGWIEIGTSLGFLGVFGLVVTRFLSRNNVLAIGDPRLAESVHGHHQ